MVSFLVFFLFLFEVISIRSPAFVKSRQLQPHGILDVQAVIKLIQGSQAGKDISMELLDVKVCPKAATEAVTA